MVTLSDVPTLPDWSGRRARRRSSSGVWIIDDADHSQPTIEVPREEILPAEAETLPRARRPMAPDLEVDLVTIPSTLRSAEAPPPRLVPIDLGDPATIPMARRPPEPSLDDLVREDEVPTSEMPARSALRESDIIELLSVDDDDHVATRPGGADDALFDLDSLIADVDSYQPHPPFPSAVSSWPVQAEPIPTAAPSFPGRPFASGLAPTSQIDRPDGASLGARAVSVLVAVAVVTLVLLAAAMMITDKSGIEAFLELYRLIGLR